MPDTPAHRPVFTTPPVYWQHLRVLRTTASAWGLARPWPLAIAY